MDVALDTGGIVRTARRPAGWVAPGPPAPDRSHDPALAPRRGEDLCWLLGDWRILQRVDGHRWSIDDLVTAWAATRWVARPPGRLADLGCGIGSVLLMLAWAFPQARCTGVEAQDLSLDLARRSVQLDGVESRCRLIPGDLRSEALAATMLEGGPGFDLVTGTPPYVPVGRGAESSRPQRGPCRVETRGGVEAYCAAAARLLASEGWFVTCAGGDAAGRVRDGARAAGLVVLRELLVEPRAGKPVLFGVWGLRRAGAGEAGAPPFSEVLVVRDARGARTPEFEGLRVAMGLPPRG